MIIPISEQYRLTSDRYQWIIQTSRHRKRNGRVVTEWKSESFYPTFEGAVRQLGERMVRESEAVGLVKALEAVKRVVTTLSQALPTHVDGALRPDRSRTD